MTLFSGHIRKQGDAVTVVELSALRTAVSSSPESGLPGGTVFADLAADCAARLRRRLALTERAIGDWSIALPAGDCTCELCVTLGAFLTDPRRRTFEWPLAKQPRPTFNGSQTAGTSPAEPRSNAQSRGESRADAYHVPVTADALDKIAWTGDPAVRAMVAFTSR